MAQIKLQEMTKRFGDTVVLDRIDLTIDDGEFFTFVGPSGCGKSTLLGLIAGIDTPSVGRLYFDDNLVNDLPPRDRDVAMVFQSYALYPHMSVRDNLGFPLANRGVPKKKIAAEVNTLAATLGLQDLLTRKPKELSGGQRQRVALGRALIRHPRVFLMDEPLSNLDAQLRLEMRVELKHLHSDYRITTVYVTHDQEEAMTLSDRIAVLDRGRLQQCGTPEDLYRAPANRFVAGFIGSPPMNMFSGDLLQDGPLLPSTFARIDLRRVIVGIRPADITVYSREQAGAVLADIALLEPTGSDLWIVGVWKGQRIRGRAGAGTRFTVGDKAFFEINFDRLHVFDAASGDRIPRS